MEIILIRKIISKKAVSLHRNLTIELPPASIHQAEKCCIAR